MWEPKTRPQTSRHVAAVFVACSVEMSMQLSAVVASAAAAVDVVGVSATPVVCHMHHQFGESSWG